MKYDGSSPEELFRTIFHMNHHCIKKEFEKRGITQAGHPPILFTLRHESKNMIASQKEIADKLGISTPTVAISIKRMEKAGLVHKIADESDLRRNLITLTEKGRQLVDEAKEVFEAVEDKMFQGFSEDELEQLTRLFLRIIVNLEKMGAQPPEHLKNR